MVAPVHSQLLPECRNKKIKENINGWATPLVVGEHYHVWWEADTTPVSVRLEVTNLREASLIDSATPEHVFLTFNYSQVWGYLGTQVSGADVYSNSTAFPDPVVNRTGESYRSFENNTLSVLLSGKDRPDTAGWDWFQRVTVVSDPCPPEGCPSPGVATVDRESQVRSASDELNPGHLPWITSCATGSVMYMNSPQRIYTCCVVSASAT